MKPCPVCGRPLERSAKNAFAFEAFWAAYPRKVGKLGAQRVWNQLKPDQALLGKMLEALDRASRSKQWREAGGQFIPYPMTWLRQGRWDDEPTVKRPEPIDWWDECKRLHAGTCGGRMKHATRLEMDAAKEQP